jgi:parvulin-like peptidyl-prolyl isomerase
MTSAGRGRWRAAGRLAILAACLAGLAAPARGSGTAAEVNGVRVAGWELERELALKISAGSFHRRVSDERRQELRCLSLRELVLKELKRQWAAENPVPVDPAAAETAWQEVRDRFSSDAQYRAALESKGFTHVDFRLAFDRDAVAVAVDQFQEARVPPPGSTEVAVFFTLHSDEYMTPEARHVIHVLVNVPPSASPEDWKRAEQTALGLAERAAAEEIPLLVVAEDILESSPPRFRDQVGDMGFVHRGSLLPAVDEAVFSTEIGAVTEPIRTIYGYHVLQVLEIRRPQPLELDDVRSAVEERIVREQRQRSLSDFERELLEGAEIEVNECTESF